MIEKEDDMLLLDPNPEDIIFQEHHIESKTIIFIELPVDSPDFEVHPYPLLQGPELHQSHPVGIMTNALPADNLVILPENVMTRTLL